MYTCLYPYIWVHRYTCIYFNNVTVYNKYEETISKQRIMKMARFITKETRKGIMPIRQSRVFVPIEKPNIPSWALIV